MLEKYNKNKKIMMALCLCGAISLLAVPLLGTYLIRLFSLGLIYAIVSMGLNVAIGYTGQFSLGQAALFAVGSYTGALLYRDLDASLWVSLIISIITGMLVGLLLGLPALKAQGHYLSLLTMGFSIIVTKIIIEWRDVLGGPLGLMVGRFEIFGMELNNVGTYYTILALCTICLFITRNLISSKFGRAFQAIRDNDLAAECMGVDKRNYKLIAFVYNAALASFAGCLFAYFSRYISPDIYSFTLSVFFLISIIMGGTGTIIGPIIGTIIMTIGPEYLQSFQEYRLLIYGCLLIAAVYAFPTGIIGITRKKFHFLTKIEKPEIISDNPLGKKDGSEKDELMTLKDVTMKFGGLYAIKDLNMTIRKGTVHSLIGPNGAGKSTMINVITGLYTPTEGDVYLNGDKITGIDPHKISKAGVGRTFQNAQIFAGMTVLENVMVGRQNMIKHNLINSLLHTKKMRTEDEAVKQKAWELLKFIGLEDYAGEIAYNLAGGQQRMLEIGRALAMEPSLLLLDEPAAGLNEAEINNLSSLIEEIVKHGITVFLIEHHLDFVMDISDTVTVLNFGEKLAEGIPTDIQNNQEVIEAYIGKEE